MHYDSEIIDLKSNNNDLSWCTIEQSIIIKGKYIRQTSSFDSFAIIHFKIEPYPVKEKAIFVNKITEVDLGFKTLYPLQQRDTETLEILQTICSGVILGIEAVVSDRKLMPKINTTIKVTALKAIYHPVDSHSKAFKMATISALLEAFNKVKLIEI